jgi:hypothetical protein
MIRSTMRTTLFSLLMCTSFIASFAHALPDSVTPQMLAGDAQSLGEYVVANESSTDKPAGDLCVDPTEYDGLSCGDKVWLYRTNDGSVIMISPVTADSLELDEVLVWTIEGKTCAGYTSVTDALAKGISHLGLCSLTKSSADATQLNAYRPVTGGDVLWDMAFGITGIIAGSHHTEASFTSSSMDTMTLDDIYQSLRIHDTMTLNRVK